MSSQPSAFFNISASDATLPQILACHPECELDPTLSGPGEAWPEATATFKEFIDRKRISNIAIEERNVGPVEAEHLLRAPETSLAVTESVRPWLAAGQQQTSAPSIDHEVLRGACFGPLCSAAEDAAADAFINFDVLEEEKDDDDDDDDYDDDDGGGGGVVVLLNSAVEEEATDVFLSFDMLEEEGDDPFALTATVQEEVASDLLSDAAQREAASGGPLAAPIPANRRRRESKASAAAKIADRRGKVRKKPGPKGKHMSMAKKVGCTKAQGGFARWKV
ncbi:hypothetical protein BD289DRAFT_509740 [Coniella lustricola]|uniref:Uncharacterized protein n=1 Tax=Coniella lustricola TaxID=2025994 RepID=A0A2T2ZTN6_9PEZI|nr:hypothetical protein BD289DRAFT_509740 [Coniella lustricola]